MDVELLNAISGGSELLAWFDGLVPSFHDAEILSLTLDREHSRCSFRVHTFQATPQTDAEGYYVLRKHVVVLFELEYVTKLKLEDFNHQNVIYSLDIVPIADRGFRVILEPCYGLAGEVEARSVSIKLSPGIPSGSIYLARPTSPGGTA